MARKFSCKKVRGYMLCALLFQVIFFLNGCSAENKEYQYKDNTHLFTYNKEDILAYIKKAGYSDFQPDEIRRNSTGSALFLYNFYRTDSMILSVSNEGQIKKLVPPARIAYLNDKEEFIAWFDDIKQGITFKNGTKRQTPLLGMLFSSFEIDPSGQYFFLKIKPDVVEIASTDDPDVALFFSTLQADKIFYRNDRIYLFARDYRKVKGPGDYEQHEIICQILKKAGTKFILEEEIQIPRPSPRSSPFFVIDVDLWSDKVLIEDSRDEPFSFLSYWFLFDLKTKKMIKIDRARDYGFFLKKNVFR